MTTAAFSATNPAQMEAANFLNLLIVDDERAIREVCREVAQSLGFNTAVADSAEHAYRLLDTQNIDVVLLDLKLPGAGGLEALHQIGERKPDAVVVVVTGYGTVQSAVQAMKNGAYDYVTKPFSMEELKLLLERVSGHLKLKTENRTLREKIKSKLGFGSIVGRAPEMEKLYRIIGKAAHSSHPVLILGESGTGKEMVATLHPFLGAIPRQAVYSGGLRLAGAHADRKRAVRVRQRRVHRGGAIAAMACSPSPKAARYFSMRSENFRSTCKPSCCGPSRRSEIRPVGSTKRIAINVRILAATNRDLEQAVAQGTFRRDLYFRLNVLSLRIPPLRDRRQDIPLLTSYFLERLARAGGHRAQPERRRHEGSAGLRLAGQRARTGELPGAGLRLYLGTGDPRATTCPAPSTARPALRRMSGNGKTQILPMAELEKQTILSTIAQLNGDKLLAARMLGIGKTTLYRKLKEYVAQD